MSWDEHALLSSIIQTETEIDIATPPLSHLWGVTLVQRRTLAPWGVDAQEECQSESPIF